MVSGNFSAIQFGVVNFHNVLINSRPFYPVTTILLKLVRALIESEPETDTELLKKLNWIKDFTHEKVKEPLSIIELCTFKNLERGLNREIEVGNKTFTLTELYNYLNEITIELVVMVADICKKYNLEIPMQSFGKSSGSVSLV